ncbi:MAG: hypothetical protein MZV70_46015 [Desulfobacterales bacterium]|nr:hypothetical protein [Desulfobacterales bacterium]
MFSEVLLAPMSIRATFSSCDVVIGLENVLQREGFDIDDAGVEPGQRDHIDVVVHHFLLGGDQEHAHLIGVVLVFAEDLEIEVLKKVVGVFVLTLAIRN